MSRSALILVAEDEETDIMILQLALQRAGLSNPVIVTRDGQQAIEYLDQNCASNLPHVIPALLLLDLKMPRLTGFDVLAWLSDRPELRHIPAVILSSSSHEGDRTKALQMGASEYYVKPNSLSELSSILQEISARWLAC
jgi:CheY-like chemotaxis protein